MGKEGSQASRATAPCHARPDGQKSAVHEVTNRKEALYLLEKGGSRGSKERPYGIKKMGDKVVEGRGLDYGPKRFSEKVGTALSNFLSEAPGGRHSKKPGRMKKGGKMVGIPKGRGCELRRDERGTSGPAQALGVNR